MTKPKPVKTVGGRPEGFDAHEVIHGMRNEFIQCRDFGHSWRPYTAQWLPTERCYETQLRCARCKTIRLRYIGNRGQMLSSRYNYAEGYTVKGMGRLDGSEKDALRLESVLRILPDDAAEDAG